jgi:hypothetical protein
MSKESTSVSVGFPLASILTVIFVIAKLMGTVAWSWWWVFSPLWISALLGIGVFVIIIIMVVAAIIAVIAAILDKFTGTRCCGTPGKSR